MNFSIQFTCEKIGHHATFYFAQKLENVENLETHLIKGSENTGDNDAPRLSMDNIKSLFGSKMV